MEEIILVQNHSTGRVKFVILTLVGDTITRKWGLVGGKIQTTFHTYGYINRGKANELNPDEAAKADYTRLIETRLKEGLQIAKSLDDLPDLNNNQMDFNNLPVQFCCSKPNTSISKTKCNKLIKDKLARFFLKYNGLCHYILVTSIGEVKIYTRRINDHTKKYLNIVKTIEDMKLPYNTLLIAEFVIDPELKISHMEGFKLMQSISKSDTLNGELKEDIKTSLALQEKHKVIAVVFNVLFSDREDFTEENYEDSLGFLTKSLIANSSVILPKEKLFDSYNEAYGWVDKNKMQYEGLVLWHAHENAEITYTGKPTRRACWKVKAVKEDDVVAYDWKECTGAKQGKVGSLLIGKYNQVGKIIPLGRVGSGLKIKQGECEIDYWELPCVIEISYSQRFPTGAYQFPSYSKKHEDKLPKDIVIDEKGF